MPGDNARGSPPSSGQTSSTAPSWADLAAVPSSVAGGRVPAGRGYPPYGSGGGGSGGVLRNRPSRLSSGSRKIAHPTADLSDGCPVRRS